MSEYAHTLDENHYVFRLRTQKDDLTECIFHYADRADMAPTLTFTAAPMQLVRSDLYYDYYEVLIETDYLRIAYYFELLDGCERKYYLGDCFCDTWEQERYEYFQLPFNLRSDRLVIPSWVQDAVVYNIFPDSFANGARQMRSRKSLVLYEGETCESLHGGTIRGIEENLDYIKDLGCNCIYLNPFFAANSYHKYDLLDYFHVDPTRGTDEDFRSLVEAAHRMGIRVLIDGVFNHVSWRHPFFQDVLQKGKESPYYDYFYDLPDEPRFPKEGEAADYLCFAYVPEMPKTNTANPKLREYFCEVGAYWIREFDADGWRLDVANEVDDVFLHSFRQAVKREKADALVIGEVWENASHYINGNMMDSAMNYDFRRFAGQFFAEGRIDAGEFDARISNLLMRYPKQAIPAQLNLLDSHDVSRFLSVCGGDYDKMELAVLFQMTFVGMPSIFYGDEKGLSGSAERDYRRPMEFSREDPLEEIYRKFIRLRMEHEALRCGAFETLSKSGGLYGYARTTAASRIELFLNAGEEPVPVPVRGEILLEKGLSHGTLQAKGYVAAQVEG